MMRIGLCGSLLGTVLSGTAMAVANVPLQTAFSQDTGTKTIHITARGTSGACCLPTCDPHCLDNVTQADCEDILDGEYLGDGTDCGDAECCLGACCIDGQCFDNFVLRM